MGDEVTFGKIIYLYDRGHVKVKFKVRKAPFDPVAFSICFIDPSSYTRVVYFVLGRIDQLLFLL